jgi:hypothetical protein
MAARRISVRARNAERPVAESNNFLDYMELEARVCNLICQGTEVRHVRGVLAAGHPPIFLTRQEPYRILRRAAENGRLRYFARFEHDLSRDLKQRYDWLHGIDVVHTADTLDIADKAADKLLNLIGGSRGGGCPKTEFHIGFTGGGLLQHTARLLAEKLRRTTRPLPKTIFFHSMVARFDEDPATDPNSFVRYFSSAPPLPVATRFIGLMAPGLVSVETAAQLRKIEGIREAYRRVGEIDVMVTSAGGHWQRGCSGLHRMYKEAGSTELLDYFEKQGCLGDLMWRPLGRNGPIEVKTGIRAMTLVDLAELPKLIAQGKWVFLIIGPCVTCHEPKTEILQTVLDLTPHLITDLVCDSLSARAIRLAHLA